nr:MAG TPA: hypothetical protein [Caudoviricetes sp.]
MRLSYWDRLPYILLPKSHYSSITSDSSTIE